MHVGTRMRRAAVTVGATATIAGLVSAGLAAAPATAAPESPSSIPQWMLPDTAPYPADPNEPGVTAPDAMTVPVIPFDSELAAAVRMLREAGVEEAALQAAQAIVDSLGQLSGTLLTERAAASPTSVPGTHPADEPQGPTPNAADDPTADEAAENTATDDDVELPADPLALLRTLGLTPLSPSVAPLCTAPTADNPLGLVTAGAGAAGGPWPVEEDLPTPLANVALPEEPIAAANETLYAFVPADADASADRTDMQVAWFNVTTLRGGFADLEPLPGAELPGTAEAPLLSLLSGVRAAPVQTGEGTVLSAVFGTAQNDGRGCFFLPAVGIVEA